MYLFSTTSGLVAVEILKKATHVLSFIKIIIVKTRVDLQIVLRAA